MLVEALVDPVLAWYGQCARDLPWRREGVSPYAVLVSEVMLQQTPVSRVLPAYAAWLERWPTVPALAAAPSGEAVRQWGRLGYPRRALRLHAAARACVSRHDGQIPSEYDDLLALPGVGAYTAAAVASFAFRQSHPVLDTNVRRVLARVIGGEARAPLAPSVAETARARALLPGDGRAPAWSVAVMELGALVCTARAPRCEACPLAAVCSWSLAGRPESSQPARTQGYEGTDRQVRGRIMAVLRAQRGAVARDLLEAASDDAVQRERALQSLLDDGLVVLAPGGFALPL
ncbi:MAG: A/G-specific adenine glycosylase [Frankiales bacterium]|nr:A/G-specific adenine glycosylase [Frankiales bacterium]